MDDERLVDIESKIAHQEHLLAELNDALSNQQGQIMQMQAMLEAAIARLKSVGEGPAQGDPLDEKPPHY